MSSLNFFLRNYNPGEQQSWLLIFTKFCAFGLQSQNGLFFCTLHFKRASEIHALRETQTRGECGKLAPLMWRVVRVSSDACISPARLSLAGTRYSQSNIDRPLGTYPLLKDNSIMKSIFKHRCVWFYFPVWTYTFSLGWNCWLKDKQCNLDYLATVGIRGETRKFWTSFPWRDVKDSDRMAHR